MPENFFSRAIANGTMFPQRFLVAIQPHLSEETFENFVFDIYKKHFSSREIDFKNPQTIYDLAIESGIDANLVKNTHEIMNSDKVKADLRTVTDEALKRGAFGVPTMFIHTENGPKMVWGCDRMFVMGNLLGEKSPPILVPEQ